MIFGKNYSKDQLNFFKSLVRKNIKSDRFSSNIINKINLCDNFTFTNNSLVGFSKKNKIDEFKLTFEPSVKNCPIISTKLIKNDGNIEQSLDIYYYDDTCGIILVFEKSSQVLNDRKINTINEYVYLNGNLNYALNFEEGLLTNGEIEMNKTEKIFSKKNKSYKMITKQNNDKITTNYYKLDYQDSDLHFDSTKGNGKYIYSSIPATKDSYIEFNSKNISTQVRKLIVRK